MEEQPEVKRFEPGKRYYSRSGASGVCVVDSRNVLNIKVSNGFTHDGREIASYIMDPSTEDWGETPCFRMDTGRLANLAYEIDRAFLSAAGLPSGRSQDAMSLRERMNTEFAVPLDEDAVLGARDFRLKLRSLIMGINDRPSRLQAE